MLHVCSLIQMSIGKYFVLQTDLTQHLIFWTAFSLVYFFPLYISVKTCYHPYWQLTLCKIQTVRFTTSKVPIEEMQSLFLHHVSCQPQTMSFPCTAEWRTHVTDKTLHISDACLNVELFNTEHFSGKKCNTTYSTFKI